MYFTSLGPLWQGFFAWLAPKMDGMLPPKYKLSHISVLGAAMVSNATKRLAAGPPSSGLEIFEGESLHALYAERAQ